MRLKPAMERSGRGCVGVLGGEFVEHVPGHDESGGEAVEQDVVEEVFTSMVLPTPIGPTRTMLVAS